MEGGIFALIGVALGVAGAWWIEKVRHKHDEARETFRVQAEDRRRLQELKLDLFAEFVETSNQLMEHLKDHADLTDDDLDETYREDLKRSPSLLSANEMLVTLNEQRDRYSRLSYIVDERVAAVAWFVISVVEAAIRADVRTTARAQPALAKGIPGIERIASFDSKIQEERDMGYYTRAYRRLRSALRQAARHEFNGSAEPLDIDGAIGWDEDDWPGSWTIWMEPGMH